MSNNHVKGHSTSSVKQNASYKEIASQLSNRQKLKSDNE
jgi:hypothetical protein